MRVVSWNIQHLEQYDQSIDAKVALHQMLESQNADVLLLQEVDLGKQRTNMSDQLAEISKSIGAKYLQFKETILIPKEDGKYGIGLASKIPVKSWYTINLRRSPIGRRLTFEFNGQAETFYVNDHPRAAIAAILENGFCVVNTHLSFMPLVAQLQMVKVVFWSKKFARKHDAKLVIGGDFNFVGTKWLRLFGLIPTVNGKTFPASNPEKQIDHFMVPKDQLVKVKQIGEIGPLSDHRWIAIEI